MGLTEAVALGETGLMSDLWPDPVPGAPFTSRSLAQLALAVAARQASDYARGMVPTGSDRIAYDGLLLHNAVRLRQLADRLIEAAVIVEREDGTDWDEIARTLDQPHASARKQWEPVVQRWQEEVDIASIPGHHDHGLPESLSDRPDDVAGDLDQWVVRHHEPLDPIVGEHPVTDTLEPMHPMLELLHLRELQRWTQEAGPELPPLLRVLLIEREAVVYTALAKDERTASPEHAASAECARACARDLRIHLALDQDDVR